MRQRLLAEFHADAQAHPPAGEHTTTPHDPRLPWLVALIERLAGEKFLLICRTQSKVLALEDALRMKTGVKVARFHEGMTILQRDRNAAWFSESDGARVLLCSEIGSEGRNFQFAHHLILWDLPLDPDLLEQRIGRLDRIGQKQRHHAACASRSAAPRSTRCCAGTTRAWTRCARARPTAARSCAAMARASSPKPNATRLPATIRMPRSIC